MTNLRKTLGKLMSEAPIIAQETKLKTEEVKRVFTQTMIHIDNNKRKPAPQAPKGGVSLSVASRKYGVAQQTISRWVQKGYVPILLRTNKELYVDEAILGRVIQCYQKNPGQGKKTIKASLEFQN